MEALATAAALAGLVDLIIKYGEKLIERCKAYAHAETALVELTIRLQNRWYKVKAQVSVLKERANELEKSFLLIQSRTLHVLESKLYQADISVQHFLPQNQTTEGGGGIMGAIILPFSHMNQQKKMTSKAKAEYALRFKTMNGIVDSIKDWQAEFDPSWYFTIVTLKKTLDAPQEDRLGVVRGARAFREARVGVFHGHPPANGQLAAAAAQVLPANTAVPEVDIFVHPDILASEKRLLLYSPFSVTEEKKKMPIPEGAEAEAREEEAWEENEDEEDEQNLIVVETVRYGPYIDINQTTSNIRRLARVLSSIDPMVFGLLRCRGVISSHRLVTTTTTTTTTKVQRTDDIQMSILFSVPEGLDTPRSFRRVLINQTPCPLNERIDLAKRLCNAVSFVHTSGFVHKNVRPETLLLFSDRKDSNNVNGTSPYLGHAFLVGFSEFRLAEGQSYLRGDDIMARNIYRHPDRQGSHPYLKHTMRHDIYSLGVCLLEIGLWFSFVDYVEDSRGVVRPEVSDRLRAAVMSPFDDDHEGQERKIWTEKDAVKKANNVKAVLTILADTRLPTTMGQEYADLTVSCLACGDVDDVDDDADPDGVVGEDHVGGGNGEKEKEEGEDVALGVGFIQHVIRRIHDIRV
ncbi:uncharacterized protein PV06_06070 [Exophiala oligosperma]|uniref:Protein kinase domain-containing protein n=1 Tax=Exophiala oligosperma TaxID=215243 RepID=A0A0D2BYL8_9EURO|nr:uncharacterized protein PV06_06070 [Exophiala oligosperma]KIW42527.1 hypothetical protein PV06_06070 [Exophiala oligosperma]